MSKRRSPLPLRDDRGRFLNSGNPNGRPKASRNKAAEPGIKIPIKRGGKTRLEDPKKLILQRLAAQAISDKSLAASRLYLREDRLGGKAAAKAAPAPAARSRSKDQTLYYEEALIAIGVLRRNSWGQLVIARSVFADLDRLFSKGSFSPRAWRAIQLAVESPLELRNRFPGRRLTYTTEVQATRARADAIDDAFADFDIMAAELAELKAKKPRR